MSAIALLSNDLLSHILRLVTAESGMSSKLAIAQVSAHWRSVALSSESPLLWTRITLVGASDFRCLSLVLQHCGPLAPLHIEMDTRCHKYDYQQLKDAARTLVPYAARIRLLDTLEPCSSLLGSQLDFPALHTLRVIPNRGDRAPPSTIRLTAPNLRVLKLSGVSPAGRFEDFLPAGLQELHINHCPGVQHTHLLAAVSRCVHLVRLTFLIDKDEIVPGLDLEHTCWTLRPLQHLETIQLDLPVPLIVKFLENALDRGTMLSTMDMHWPSDHAPEDLVRLWKALLRHVGPITRVNMDSKVSVVLNDGAGRVLDIGASLLPTARLWWGLGEAGRAHEAVRELEMPYCLWNTLAEDFAVHPPRAVRKLRVRVRWYDIDDLVLDVLTKVAFPALERVDFAADNAQFPPVLAIHVLRHIALSVAQEIEVKLEGPVDDVAKMRAYIQRAGGGRWRVLNGL